MTINSIYYIIVENGDGMMILKGFKFGLLLQFAVGPMCIMVFESSANHGILAGLSVVLAVTLIDALYITLSGAGVAAVINKPGIKMGLKIFGAVVLLTFAADTILSVFNIKIIPDINLLSSVKTADYFLKGIVMTASNPLTIIFWSGVFSTKVIENRFDRRQLVLFGAGCVLSTLIFMSVVAVLGTVISGFLSDTIIKALNVAVGLALIFFAVKLLVKKV